MFDNSPYYMPRNTGRLVDIVRDHYDSFVDRFKYNSKVSYYSVIDDLDVIKLGKPVDKLVKKTSRILDKTKNLNHPLIKATCLSIAANMTVSYLTKDNNWGYFAESMIYSPAFAYLYWNANNKAGVSNAKIFVDLAVIGTAGLLLSVGPYRMGRNEIINQVVQHNYLGFIHDPDSMRSVAAGLTQFGLIFPFAAVLNPIKKGLDRLDKKYKFKNKLVDSMDTPTEMWNNLRYNTKKVSAETTIAKRKSPIDDDVRTGTNI